jgi:3-phosphoshikimate 1-carboxyvinyltransferase
MEHDYVVNPGGHLAGRLRVPGDKSISHRAVMLGAIAQGATRIRGLLEGDDVLATLAAFRSMGVQAEGPQAGELTVHGVGPGGLQAPAAALDLGNSGTAMRLLCGLLCGQGFDSTLTGDESLVRRPMGRVADPLRSMGAQIDCAEGDLPPLRIKGGQPLHGIDYRLPVASAQVKSAILLAGLYADGETAVEEPAPTRDHTERMLAGFGYPVERDGDRISLRGGGTLQGRDIEVPGDISSAAFFLVGASVAEGSDLVLENIGINPTRTGVLNILCQMGADITLANEREVGGEPVADIRVRSARLRGIHIPESDVPLAIDEFPALFVAAAAAEGRTVLTGAEELRVKESDRIAVMADGLRRLGVSVEETADGAIIQGRDGFEAGEVHSHGDHRVAMAFAMAALRARGELRIRDCRNVATSFPGFVALAGRAGLGVSGT